MTVTFELRPEPFPSIQARAGLVLSVDSPSIWISAGNPPRFDIMRAIASSPCDLKATPTISAQKRSVTPPSR